MPAFLTISRRSAMANEYTEYVANHKENHEDFHVFTRHRPEQQKVWLENDFVPKVRDLFVQDNPTTNSEFRILAVGSNEGLFDRLLINALFSYTKELMERKKVVYTVVEPNKVAIDEFKRKVSSQDSVFGNMKFNWINKGMEEFFQVPEPERYDLIQFVHCIYYAENQEEILRSAYDKLLANPGCILTVVVTEENIWARVVESFDKKIPSLVLKQFTNIELAEICKRNRWAYEMFDAKLDLEVTEVFNEDDPVGQAILKFLLHISEKPKEKFSKQLMVEIMEFFKNVSWEKMKDGKKSSLVNEDDGVLLIYKRS